LFCFCSISPTTTPREPSRGQRWPPTPLSSLSSRSPFGVCRCCRPRGCGSTPFRRAREILRLRRGRRQGWRDRRRPGEPDFTVC
ncbi:unnamed protein product, partial [Ectocarpus sp. 12 AP-2014]